MEKTYASDAADTQQLVARARAGDAACLEELFSRVADRVLVYVRCTLRPGSRFDEWDVLQETYVAALQSLEGYDPERSPFVCWLYGIARNRLRDMLDHHAAQKRAPAQGFAQASRIVENVRASQTGPATAFARQESHQQLVIAMQELEEEERRVLLLRFFEGKQQAEIAELLETSPRSVRRLLSRAEANLGAALRRLREGKGPGD